jgi:hypothetical protein
VRPSPRGAAATPGRTPCGVLTSRGPSCMFTDIDAHRVRFRPRVARTQRDTSPARAGRVPATDRRVSISTAAPLLAHALAILTV